jgi:4-diphosphocytidyl-2C-methyl-D-erythritol kinase
MYVFAPTSARKIAVILYNNISTADIYLDMQQENRKKKKKKKHDKDTKTKEVNKYFKFVSTYATHALQHSPPVLSYA